MSMFWLAGWFYTAEIDKKEHGLLSFLGLAFTWPTRLAEIHKEKKGQGHE